MSSTLLDAHQISRRHGALVVASHDRRFRSALRLDRVVRMAKAGGS